MMEENGLPRGWVEVDFGSIVDIFNHKRIPLSSKQRNTRKGIYPYYGASNIVDYIDDYIFDGEFLLISEDGENLNTRNTPIAFIAKGKFWVNNHAHIIKGKQPHLTKYLELYFSKLDISAYITGAVQPKLSKMNLVNIPILIPKSIPEQKAIASILTSFDDKIELLQAQNETLETIAQTIFKEWFGKYQVGDELPEGWRVGKLGKEFDIIMGQSPKGTSYNTEKKGTIFFQGRAEFTERFPQIRLYTTEPKRMANKFDVLVSVRAPVGDINVALDKCCIGRGLAAVSSLYKSYCLYKLKSLKPVFDLFESEGTVFGSINKASFSNIEVVIPTDDYKEELNSLLFNLDLKIYNNYLQIQTLQQTRDTLLPKLMSGQLRVAEFKEQLSEVM